MHKVASTSSCGFGRKTSPRPRDQETRPWYPPPNNTNEESKQNRSSTPPTIRKMAEGWRKMKEEKAESNKRMENYWNMVGLVGWWRRVENENIRRIKDHEKKQEEGVRKSSDRKSQSSANLSFFPD